MNSLVWHIVKKDFRHLRGLVAAYWLVLATHAAMPTWLFSQAPYFHLTEFGNDNRQNGTELYLAFNLIAIFLFWVGAVLVAVIGARLVLANSPNVENAQWRTLPVTRARMLTAKALSLVLMTALPYCACGVLVKILQGFPLIDWLAGSGMALVLILFCAVPAMLAAVLFESTTLRVIFFLGLIGIGLTIWGFATGNAVNNPDKVTTGCVVIFFLLGSGLIVLRYLGLNKMACVGLLITALLALWGGLPTLLPALIEEIPTSWDPGHADNFASYSYIHGHLPPTNETTGPTITIQPAGYTQTESRVNYGGQYQAPHAAHSAALLGRIPSWPENLPQGEIALLDYWDLPRAALPHKSQPVSGHTNGDYIDSQLYNISGDGLPLNLSALAAAAGLGQLHSMRDDNTKPGAWPILGLYEMDDLRLTLPDKVTATLHYATGTFHRVGEMPLQPGAQTKYGSTLMSFGRVEIDTPASKFHINNENIEDYSTADLDFGHQWTQVSPWPAVAGLPPLRADATREFYFLWNPKEGNCFAINLHGEAIYHRTTAWWQFWKLQAFDTAFCLQQAWAFLELDYIDNGQRHLMTEAEAKAWLADAKLVVVEFTPKHFYQATATFGPLEHPPVAANP